MKYTDLSPAGKARFDARQAREATRRAKLAAVERTAQYLIGRLDSSFPGAETLEDLAVLRWIRNAVVPAARSAALDSAAAQYVYARGKVSDIRDGTQSTDYDPATDGNWPT